jgi:dihydrofolate reductase
VTVGKLVHVVNLTLDGFIEDEHGSLDWGAPTDELFVHLTNLIRPLETHLYGRRLYETMAPWETGPELAAQSDLTAEFAGIWQAAEKVVYSTTLAATSTERTRIERTFDPAAVRALKAEAPTDLLIGGAELNGHALRAGLVDELHLLARPVLVGRGKPALPDDVRVELELVDERRIGDVVHLHYRVLH